MVPEPKLDLFSPRHYQVFQRSSENEGTIVVSGHTTTDADEIKVRVTGKSIAGPLPGEWQTIPIVQATRSFAAELPLPAGGWYTLDVEALRDGAVLAEAKVESFGVGEVFVGAGQSNSTNFGEIRTQQKSGMVSSFGGEAWQLADDPQPGVADKTQGGSFWPAFGDAMYERLWSADRHRGDRLRRHQRQPVAARRRLVPVDDDRAFINWGHLDSWRCCGTRARATSKCRPTNTTPN